MTPSSRLPLFAAALSLGAALATTGCGSENSGTPGGFVEGPADAHCGTTVQKVDPNACMVSAGTGGSGGSGGSMSTGGSGGSHTHEHEHEPETQYNSEADDDDCKYHVKVGSTDVFKDTDVTFSLTLTSKEDNSLVTGADPDIEAYLDETHPAPNTDQSATEKSDGNYEIGPIQFDEPGRWTVRFHFFDDCTDGEESPHSHVAFYVDVP